jgi:hypothetical protein
MPGLNVNLSEVFSPRVIVRKAAAYTVLATDELIQVNGTYTMTLPALDSFQGTSSHKKAYKFQNVHATATATIAPGTSAITGAADTIQGKTSITLLPNESIVLEGSEGATSWTIMSPSTFPSLIRVPFAVVVAATGTTAANVFDADGAPANIDITCVLVQATGANSGIANVWQQGTSSIASITMTTANPLIGGVVGMTAGLSNAAIAAGTAITVSCTSSATPNIIIIGTMQMYAGTATA